MVKHSLNSYNLQINNNTYVKEDILNGSYEIISNLLKDNLDKLKHTMKKINK